MTPSSTRLLVVATFGIAALCPVAASPSIPSGTPAKGAQPEVVAAATVEIQTVVVQDKATRPLGSDKAVLEMGKRGGVKKHVSLKPGPKSKAKATLEVDVAVLATPVSATSLAVELEIETIAKAAGAATPVRSKMRVTLEPGGVKFVNVFSDDVLGASVNAFIRAEQAEPVVRLPTSSAPAEKTVTLGQPVAFEVKVKRVESGEEVYGEDVTLNTYMGRPAAYQMVQDVPTEVVASKEGPGSIVYSSEKAQLVLTPRRWAGAEIEVDVQVVGSLLRGSDLVNAHQMDRTVSQRVAAGRTFSIYAIYGRDDLVSLPAAERASASGYIFEITLR